MMRWFTAALVLAAFGVTPLAQAVDCVMHQPMAQPCHEMQGDHDTMPVVDCFSSLQSGMLPMVVADGIAHHADFASLPDASPLVKPIIIIADISPLRDRLLHAPPDDIILLTGRRRI